MAESDDSSGEELGLIRPRFIRELRNILDEYPDDGQILKEMIQNAEDAGASTIQFIVDTRQFLEQVEMIKIPPYFNYFKGPALCVYNDAYFTDHDWEGIRMLHTSIKEKDPMKVGRFGLGFKSVFHLTDRLVILSGERIMYMDPFKSEDKYCKSKRTKRLKGKELQVILNRLRGIFNISEMSFSTGFQGTLFWFPLRSEPSELSETLYTNKNMEDLMNSFKAEGRTMMLFLKNIESIYIFYRDDNQSLQEIYHVAVESSCLQRVRVERKSFIDSLELVNGTLPHKSISSQILLFIETVDQIKSTKEIEQWVVVNFHPGKGDVTSQLSALCTNPKLSYQPFVGVAMPLDGQDDFQSHLFCFLPLPLDTSSPTGLPVHVNGFFALSQNRRHIKWPTADQQRLQAHLEDSVRWNCLLVEELLPQAYVILINRLRELYIRQPDGFYSAWPDITKVTDKWRPLLNAVYKEVITKDYFYTEARGGSWIYLTQAVLYSLPVHLDAAIRETIVKVYNISNENLVHLPRHIEKSLQHIGFQTERTVSHHSVSALARNCLSNLDASDKLNLLQYFFTYHKPEELLINMQLLPLQNGTFGIFERNESGVNIFYLCEERLMEILPGLENIFCSFNVHTCVREHLHRIALSGAFNLQVLQDSSKVLPNLIKSCLKKMKPILLVKWIEPVWNLLSTTPPWNSDLTELYDTSLLPEICGDQMLLLPLTGIYVCCSVPGLSCLPQDLVSSLSKLEIKMLPTLPNYITRHSQVLGNLVQYPTTEGIVAAIRNVCSNEYKAQAAIQAFNSSATSVERGALMTLLSESTFSLQGIQKLIRKLKLFSESETNVIVSLDEISVIAPQHLPPVRLPKRYISCDQSSRRAAIVLGATEEPLVEIVRCILLHLRQRSSYAREEIITFMKYFVNSSEFVSNISLLSLAKEVKFLPAASGQLKSADELYDSGNELLTELFMAEDKFPHGDFAQPEYLASLRKLGLRSESDVLEGDLVSAALSIQDYMNKGDMPLATRKARALWKMLADHGHSMADSTLIQLSCIQCLPCLQRDEQHGMYPQNMPLMSKPEIVQPSKMCHGRFLHIVGSVMPVLQSGMPDEVCQKLAVNSEVNIVKIFQHLHKAIRHFNTEQISIYQVLFHEMFQLFSEHSENNEIVKILQNESCILIESECRFAKPNKFWVEQRKGDIDLRPYRFLLSREMSNFQKLLLKCGSHLRQDIKILTDVLAEIQEKHQSSTISQNEIVVDMRLVIQILDVLKRTSAAQKSNVIIPIWHKSSTSLHFRQAKDCTIGKGSWQLHGHIGTCTEDEILFVHPDIPETTAMALGALNMKERALTGAEELDFGYGQHEDLIKRLHNLLKDAYTDGFSVPKELIQNADDAGATEFKILLDERENKDARTNLITEQMASLQGPALWAFNNAVFSDEDFKNIVNLGGGSKENDTTKIGKFGLGFNSVYNLTDVPSFISRHVMAMFDPQVKYLEGSGLKLDFKKSVNQNLLRKMPEIFKPFQNVFECRLDSGEEVNYKGTLFRFPLRLPEQAEDSKLKNDSYTDAKRKEFLRMILERAGNLLLFTQNIKRLEVYYLPKTCDDPSQAICLQTVTKHSESELLNPKIDLCNQSILKFCSTHWSTNHDIKIQESVEIEIDTTTFASEVCKVNAFHNTSQWHITWATGTDQSAEIAINYKCIPLAGAAVLMQNGRIVSIANSPNGFYKSGHLFCFLPLPEEMVRMSLPVHLNATFALSSSRRGLLVKTEDDLSNPEADWNSALFADAICRVYLLLLETMQRKTDFDNDFNLYFDLWPTIKSDPNLIANFSKHLVNDGNKVFPTSEGRSWISFQNAVFLDPDFRISACGNIAMDTLRRLVQGYRKMLVDVPQSVCQFILRSEQRTGFLAKVILQLNFFKNVLFPNIQCGFWNKNERDQLVHHALVHKDPDIYNLVRNYACIPSADSDVLRKPCDLIHPYKMASSLFLVCEGHFPQDSKTIETTIQDAVDFCSVECLDRLVQLGMITDDLPESLLLERAASISTLFKINSDHAIQRSYKFIEYISSLRGINYRLSNYSSTAKETLSKIEFLPVQAKPDTWGFPWSGGIGKQMLAAPSELFHCNLIYLVACTGKLLDLKFENSSLVLHVKREMFRSLGLKMEENYKDTEMIKLSFKQLFIIVENHQTNPQADKELTEQICRHVYSYLNRCCQVYPAIKLNTTKSIVWTGSEFVPPSLVSFKCPFDCRPFLFSLENPLKQHVHLCKAIGVKEEFTQNDIILVLEKIRLNNEGCPLPINTIQLLSRLAQLLCGSVRKYQSDHSHERFNICLPDRSGYLQHVDNLCLDDCPWLTESETMKFVHDSIPPETAKLLGIQSKRVMDYNSISDTLEFGQSEKLTTRIKRLLEGYTCDFSLFKELVQNADDTGATEIKFIKDFRNLKVERVPIGWEALQGPALCVYNNKSFTSEDIKGIQSLGEGSKRRDILKTGKYGVGFNAVYHLTDVPSFWTRENDVKEVICAFDPNCRYVMNATPQRPGIKFTNIERVKTEYPDMFSGYLGKAIDMSKPGTMFRLPLRTTEMAKTSKLRPNSITSEQINRMLNQFTLEINICLLFLKNLRKIGIYSVNVNGVLIPEHEVNMTVDARGLEELQTFTNHLHMISNGIKNKTVSLHTITECEAVASITLTNTRKQEEEWLVVNRAGFSAPAKISRKLHKEWQDELFLLPRGGVAVKVAETNKNLKAEVQEYLAFCDLPLPIQTKLPVHINGHFALDLESRRNLWISTVDAKTEWNEKIVSDVIVPAYITAIMKAKGRWFGTMESTTTEQDLTFRLKLYHNLFPCIKDAPSEFWGNLMKELYRQVAQRELNIFPVKHSKPCRLQWVPAVKKNGYPGYFHNLSSQSLSNGAILISPLIASNSLATQMSYQPYDENWSGENSEKLLGLLKCLNMKVLESPFHIFTNFKCSGVADVHVVTPESVIQFLKTGGTRDGCNLINLPQHVKITSLKSATNVKHLIHFVKHDRFFLDKLQGLPLSLRQSEILWPFQNIHNTEKPIVSDYFDLLPGSGDLFLHKEIYGFFRNFTDTQLRVLDLSTFAFLLPKTLQEIIFKTRMQITLDLGILPFPNWLKRLWLFLQNQIVPVEGTSDSDIRAKAYTKLSCLYDWNLIPVKRRDARIGEQAFLYPFKDIHNIVFLHSACDKSNPRLWNILIKLPLAFLDMTHLPKDCFATRIVASISHPIALLQALTSLDSNIKVPSISAYEILSHFSRCLPSLRESYASVYALQTDLKKLPFYTLIDGHTASLSNVTKALCLSREIPSEGLVTWSESTFGMLAFLCEELVPVEMRRFLCLKSPSTAEFYYRYLLPTLDNLQRDAIGIHMKYIKNKFLQFNKDEKLNLEIQLKATPFVERNGRLYKACEFFSADNPVFRAMCPKESFPPAPWNGSEWTQFMHIAGILHEVTEDLFVQFASELQNAGRSGLTENIISKSDTLVQHLFQMKNLTEGGFLSRVRGICFVRPSQWLSSPEGQSLSNIAQPFSPERLVSFSESCSEQHLCLVWSSSCILHPDADPTHHVPSRIKKKDVLTQLHFPDNAPKEKVFQHIANICAFLTGNEYDKSFKYRNVSTDLLRIIMTRLYEYLNTNTTQMDHLNLRTLPIICDIEKYQMLFADNVVLELQDKEVIEGYINKAPVMFGAFFPFFTKLGVSRQVTANHYANVLLKLRSQAGNEILHVEEMKIVQKAVKGLFRCLKSESQAVQQLRVSDLFLPSEEGDLWLSSKLIFDDNAPLRTRVKEPPEGNKFFIGFVSLGISSFIPLEDVKRLPEKHQMISLTTIVKEVIPESIKHAAMETENTRALASLISDPFRIDLIMSLINHVHRQFSVELAEQIYSQLQQISVKEVSDLQTMLMLKDTEVPGSLQKKLSFTEISNGETKTSTVYLDLNACRDMKMNNGKFCRSLGTAVEYMLSNMKLDKNLLQSILTDPEEVLLFMSSEGISQCNFSNRQEQSVFPPPGSFIPVAQHCQLDNNLFDFYEGEHVGFEVYDPHLEDGDTDDTDPVFIYAIVICEVTNGTANVPLLQKRYHIDLGLDRGKAEVSVTKLYKFIRKANSNKNKSKALQGYTQQPDNEENIQPMDFASVLKEIRRTLIEAWKLPNEKDRMRVVKRLYLKWHPDKNMGNEEFCKRVIQVLQQYIDILKNGGTLQVDEDDRVSDPCDHHTCQSSSSSFFQHMNHRSQRQKTFFDEEAYTYSRSHHKGSSRASHPSSSSSSRYSSEPNPQPGEVRRWYRQARADLSAAQEAMQTCSQRHNWICFQSHQAAEKALKAVMYHRDSNGSDMRSHDLVTLAMTVGDEVILKLARELEECVGSYIRMRYPDVRTYPMIPAEIYTAQDASHACDLAVEILKKTGDLLKALIVSICSLYQRT